METRVAVMGIIVEEFGSAELLNALLHEYGRWIIGRMGVPYREKGINIVSIAIMVYLVQTLLGNDIVHRISNFLRNRILVIILYAQNRRAGCCSGILIDI